MFNNFLIIVFIIFGKFYKICTSGQNLQVYTLNKLYKLIEQKYTNLQNKYIKIWNKLYELTEQINLYT